jgi:nucleoid-associated protein YgaU
MANTKADRKKKESKASYGESYSSLILGIIVVIVTSVILIFLIKNKNIIQQKRIAQSVSSTNISATQISQTSTSPGKNRTHVVSVGENLWQIAEKYYKSGYNWVDIANANKLTNPGMINTGMKLLIPNVALKLATINTPVAVAEDIYGPKISTASYTVSEGDHLWGIAVRSYSDGYKWVEIAKLNNIANPDIIRPGMVLKLPRASSP